MPFQPGQSGNPLGRPRGTPDRRRELRTLLESHSEELITEAVARALSGSDSLLALLVGRLIAQPRAEALSIDVSSQSEWRVRWLSSADGGPNGD